MNRYTVYLNRPAPDDKVVVYADSFVSFPDRSVIFYRDGGGVSSSEFFDCIGVVADPDNERIDWCSAECDQGESELAQVSWGTLDGIKFNYREDALMVHLYTADLTPVPGMTLENSYFAEADFPGYEPQDVVPGEFPITRFRKSGHGVNEAETVFGYFLTRNGRLVGAYRFDSHYEFDMACDDLYVLVDEYEAAKNIKPEPHPVAEFVGGPLNGHEDRIQKGQDTYDFKDMERDVIHRYALGGYRWTREGSVALMNYAGERR